MLRRTGPPRVRAAAQRRLKFGCAESERPECAVPASRPLAMPRGGPA
eukprot:COSAG02_NODE_2886_length_7814_cov_3.379123_2_plen_47_part_00